MGVSGSITLIFRLVQLLCTVAIMALVGHILSTSYWNQIPRTVGNAPEVNFTMFLSVFTLFSLFFLGPASWNFFTNESVFKVATVIDALNLVFYMSDGIALAAAMEVHSCNNPVYTEGNRITQTSPNTKVRCREAQATTAFVWFMFILFIITTAISLSKWWGEFELPNSTSHTPRSIRRRNRGDTTGDEEERHDVEEVSGGPMVADDPTEPARLHTRRNEHRRVGSLTGGHWHADSDDGISGVSEVTDHDAGYRRGGDRVINVPMGGPAFADEGTGLR
ncbi:membrane-associating domain-domain-containing protein [Clohesyomyces aquaticus]|uniref:Membrane-associating domain-domain-containing protein n=1 Tax=Clohesyomyces aquaticus TaxID=1231657 RepID=A0A1Y1ZBV5_9PLEO|nr:membrane-associating domain-domain-containing protein [Clohesyomyces aquaticus]